MADVQLVMGLVMADVRLFLAAVRLADVRLVMVDVRMFGRVPLLIFGQFIGVVEFLILHI